MVSPNLYDSVKTNNLLKSIAKTEGVTKEVFDWFLFFKEDPSPFFKEVPLCFKDSGFKRVSTRRFAQHVKAAITGKPLRNRAEQPRIFELCDKINEHVFPQKKPMGRLNRKSLIGKQDRGFLIVDILENPNGIAANDHVTLKCIHCGAITTRHLRRFLYTPRIAACPCQSKQSIYLRKKHEALLSIQAAAANRVSVV